MKSLQERKLAEAEKVLVRLATKKDYRSEAQVESDICDALILVRECLAGFRASELKVKREGDE